VGIPNNYLEHSQNDFFWNVSLPAHAASARPSLCEFCACIAGGVVELLGAMCNPMRAAMVLRGVLTHHLK
jgi:hypothetical protein